MNALAKTAARWTGLLEPGKKVWPASRSARPRRVICSPAEVREEEHLSDARDHETEATMGRCNSNGVIALSAMPIGQKGVVVRLNGGRDAKLKLYAIGVVPGTPIVLEQLDPAVVFKMGRSRFAVDRELGASIDVRPVD